MVISIKDSLKFIGVSIVCLCAVFVCTFFLNFYLDISPMRDVINEEYISLFNAQLAMAKITCAITGGILALIAILMLIFYIKLYIDEHSKEIGILKAMGYSNFRIARSFTIFGLSVFIGCLLGFSFGYAMMPTIYKQLIIDGLPDVSINFHLSLLFGLIIIPTLVFTLFSLIFAFFELRKPALQIINGNNTKNKFVNKKKSKYKNVKDQPFLIEICKSTLCSKKMLAFFVAFSCFCFSAMVQMGLSMEDIASGMMGMIILIIGLILAVTTMFMSMTSLLKANIKSISIMNAFGYSLKDCFISVFACYIPFAIIGFGLGTIYQYGLLSIMLKLFYKDLEVMPSYSFNVLSFFITLTMFIFFYVSIMIFYTLKIKRITLKEVMLKT